MDLLEKTGQLESIDVQNLFNYGDCVPWLSDGEPGFLSFKRCPNLWNLGARPNNRNNESALNLIESIISCANTYAYSQKTKSTLSDNNIYIRAYKELATYLMHLFIFYNEKISDDELKKAIENWGWYKLFKNLKNNPDKFGDITIVTYNYDIWLERILYILGFKFNILGITREEDSLIDIIKPHGSISFQSKRLADNSAFEINYNRDIFGAQLEDLNVEYNNLRVNSTINAIIPPSGDSYKYSAMWSNSLQAHAKAKAKELIYGDEVIICGVSYGYVDRLELDDLLLSFDVQVNLKMLNPFPPSTLNAVISSLFKQYTVYTNSNILGGIYE